MPETMRNATDFASPHSSTAGIQEAVDALPRSGGTVLLPPGRYPLRRSVQLRSAVTLVVAQRTVHRAAWHLEAVFSEDVATALRVADPSATIAAFQ